MGGTDYTAKVEKRMVVMYNCENCGSHSQYSICFSGSGKARVFSVAPSSEQEISAKMGATSKAQADVNKKIAEREKNKDFGYKRCPQCGYIQSWMLQSAKKGRNQRMGWLLAALLFAIQFWLWPAFRDLFTGIFTEWDVGRWGQKQDFGDKVFIIFWVCLKAGFLLLIPAALFEAFLCPKFPFHPNKKFGKLEHTNSPIIHYQ